MLTKEKIREAACETVREHGLPLVRELEKGKNFNGVNLVALLEVFGQRLTDAPAGTHTFGSIMLTALETIATLPLEEQDNMMATNMRHVARMALDCRSNVRAEAGPTAKRQARAVENAPAHCAGLAF